MVEPKEINKARTTPAVFTSEGKNIFPAINRETNVSRKTSIDFHMSVFTLKLLY